MRGLEADMPKLPYWRRLDQRRGRCAARIGV